MSPDASKTSLENRLALLLEAGKDKAVPCFSTSLQRLLSLNPEDQGSMESLTEIILNDYGLMNKVLQTVNSFYYNRFGREITTVSHAVLLLGFNTIKDIATGMAVINLLGDRENLQAAKLMGRAFISAHMSAAVTGHAREKAGQKMEETFIAALLRQLPRIMIAVTDPAAYQELTELEADGSSSARRCIRTVGYKLKECWNLPDGLAGNFEACASLSSSADPVRRRLAKQTAELAEMALARQDLAEILEEMGRDFHLDPQVLKQELAKAVKKTLNAAPEIKKAIMASTQKNARVLSLQSGERELDTKMGKEPKDNDSAGGPEASPALPEAEGSEGGKANGMDRDLLFMELIQNLMGSVNDTTVPLPQIFLMAIEIIRRALPVNNVLLCMMKPDKRGMTARFGTGENAGFLKRAVSSLKEIHVGPIGRALSKDAEEIATWSELLGAAIEGRIPSAARCLITPIVINGRAIGCLLMDSSQGSELEGPALQKISMIRQLLVSATKLRAGIRA